ncbi:MAG: deoxynucleoside kinase [Candidatus ainarchaeum sp.]|nr:deoxynucleoside kinase [Candidatus ainarchaeum sp.]
MKGAIIVFEGTDASGKATQTKLFFEKLQFLGIEAELFSFPRYDSFFGSLAGKHLSGEFGPIKSLAPEFCALLYSLDRYQIKKEIEEKVSAGKILVMNRYVQSNIAHQTAKFSLASEQKKFLFWVESLESRMPRADAVVFLNMPTEVAQKLMAGQDRKEDYRKGSEKDLHEADAAYLERTRKVYASLAKKNRWIAIDCAVKKHGSFFVRPQEDIHSEIWKKLKKKLKL